MNCPIFPKFYGLTESCLGEGEIFLVVLINMKDELCLEWGFGLSLSGIVLRKFKVLFIFPLGRILLCEGKIVFVDLAIDWWWFGGVGMFQHKLLLIGLKRIRMHICMILAENLIIKMGIVVRNLYDNWWWIMFTIMTS